MYFFWKILSKEAFFDVLSFIFGEVSGTVVFLVLKSYMTNLCDGIRDFFCDTPSVYLFTIFYTFSSNFINLSVLFLTKLKYFSIYGSSFEPNFTEVFLKSRTYIWFKIFDTFYNFKTFFSALPNNSCKFYSLSFWTWNFLNYFLVERNLLKILIISYWD